MFTRPYWKLSTIMHQTWLCTRNSRRNYMQFLSRIATYTKQKLYILFFFHIPQEDVFYTSSFAYSVNYLVCLLITTRTNQFIFILQIILPSTLVIGSLQLDTPGTEGSGYNYCKLLLTSVTGDLFAIYTSLLGLYIFSIHLCIYDNRWVLFIPYVASPE